MGLAASQASLLGLTARKNQIELQQSFNAMHKLALTRESSELSRSYNAKLQARNLTYYADGKYNKINYGYLMGYGHDWTSITHGTKPLKNNPNMILSDYKGRVVLNEDYAKLLRNHGCAEGKTFSRDMVKQIVYDYLNASGFWPKNINTSNGQEMSGPDFVEAIRNGAQLQGSVTLNTNVYNTLTGESKGTSTENVELSQFTQMYKNVIDFYYAIFESAATNGWTTEYNNEINTNEDYISDALQSGVLQLQLVDSVGNYDVDGSLTYFIVAGEVDENRSAEAREELTAWYNAEREKIEERESILDLEQTELSAELEATNAMIKSIQSIIDDAIETSFNFGNA